MERLTIGRGWPMVHLEDWMNIQEMHQIGMSQCQIAARLDLDRKTVRKYLHGPPSDYPTRSPRLNKVDPYRSYLRERWEQGVHNSHKLFLEIQKRGYQGATHGFVTCSRTGESKNGNEPSCASRRHPASKASSTGRTSATFSTIACICLC